MIRSDLYFILNPALGIIKIGIAKDVGDRLRCLQHSCGIALEVLAIVERGGRYEQHLHRAFTPHRLHGEWFNPSAELLALIDAPHTIPAFLERMAPQIAEWDRARDEKIARQREERAAIRQAAKDQAKKKKAAAAKRAATRQATELRRAAEYDAEVALQREAWLEHNPELVDRVVRSEAVTAAVSRRAQLAEMQRSRNAALVGVLPEALPVVPSPLPPNDNGRPRKSARSEVMP